MAVNGSNAHLRFINETAKDGHERTALSPVKRQIVRSQAMIAVRRKQRQDAETYLQLRWTRTKLGSKSDSQNNPAVANDNRSLHSVGKYRFVAETHSVGAKMCQGLKESANSDLTSPKSQSSNTRQETPKDEDTPAKQAALVKSGYTPPVRGPIEIFGGGRRNPFESYPVPFSDEVNELMDHCESTLPVLNGVHSRISVFVILIKSRHGRYSIPHVRYKVQQADAKTALLSVFR